MAEKKYEFKTNPYDFQRAALTKGWNRPFFAYLMDRGTGKTKVTIDNVGILFERGQIEAFLLIAPNGVHERWVTEQIPEHLPDRIEWRAAVWAAHKAKTKKGMDELEAVFAKDPGVLQILTMNVESFQMGKAKNMAYNFCRTHTTLVAVDESTRIKGHGSNRTKSITKLRDMAPYRRILTGNEVTNSPFDVYSQFEFLAEGYWGGKSHYWFTRHYGQYENQFVKIQGTKQKAECGECGSKTAFKVVRYFDRGTKAWKTKYECKACQAPLDWTSFREKSGRMHYFLHKVGSEKKLEVTNTKLIREIRTINEKGGLREFPKLLTYKNLAELRERIKRDSYRILKKDALDLPPKIYTPIYCEMNDAQKQAYQELEEEFRTVYKDHELTVKNKVSLLIRFQQIVGGFFPETDEPLGDNNPKLDALMYDLEDVTDGAKVIIWSVFPVQIVHIARALRAAYPERATATYYGATKRKERDEIVSLFQQGEIDYLVANPATAGTGLNLQASTLHYYFSDSFKLEDRWQSEDRSHRRGQHNPVLYKDIYIRGTVDDTIKRSRDTKTEIAEFFRDHEIEELI